MKCRHFQRSAADWAAGRLGAGEAAEMRAHALECAACARIEAEERAMREVWVADSWAEPRDLWPLIAARIAEPEARPARPARPRWTLAGLMAAGAACAGLAALVLRGTPPTPTQAIAPPGVDEGRVVRLVAEVQEMPAVDFDSQLQERDALHARQRMVLLGGGGR